MRKILSILIALVMTICISSTAQSNQYSYSGDTAVVGTLNVKMFNSPNITLQDGTLSNQINAYRLEQQGLSDSIRDLTLKFNNLEVRSPKEVLVKNKGYTDDQIRRYVLVNTSLSLTAAIFVYILFLIFTGKQIEALSDPWAQLSSFVLALIEYSFLAITIYYLLSIFFNREYLVITEWLTLFG